MKRKDYQKPTMNVVKLQHQAQLLQASINGTEASRNGYGKAIEQTWGSDES